MNKDESLLNVLKKTDKEKEKLNIRKEKYYLGPGEQGNSEDSKMFKKRILKGSI